MFENCIKKWLGDFGLKSITIDATKNLKNEIDRKLDEESKSFLKIPLGSIVMDPSLLEAKNAHFRYPSPITNRGPDR